MSILRKLKGLKKRYQFLKMYVTAVKKISGKNKFIDILLSRIFLGTPYNFYLDFAFYNKSWKNRKKYIYEDDEYAFWERYNIKGESIKSTDKLDLLKKTVHYMNRKIISTTNLSFDEFKKFTQSLNSFFYKPSHGSGGEGIEKIVVDNSSLLKLYDKIKSLPDGLLEETVIQHKDLDKLCPNLLQTIRFTVFMHKDGPKILFASIKSSISKNAIVDNAHGGGIYANIDLETGKIKTNAYRSFGSIEDLDVYGIDLYTDNGLEKHPITDTYFKGFQIPMFEDAKKLVIDMSNELDLYGHRLIGYDIAITSSGPLLIEANHLRPGISNVWQTACKDTPLKPVIEEMFKE